MSKKEETELVSDFVVSHTRLQSYLNCRKLYEHQYINKVTTKSVPVYLTLGIMVHKFLEHYYTTGTVDPGVADSIYKEVDVGILSEKQIDSLKIAKATYEGITRTYPGVHKEDLSRFKKFITEKSEKIRLAPKKDKYGEVNNYYMGIIDMIAQDTADDYWIIETKTAAVQTIDANYFKRLPIDSQIMGQLLLAKKFLGDYPKGVIYNVIIKPSIYQRKTETIATYCKRVIDYYIEKGNDLYVREYIEIRKEQLDEWHKNVSNLTYEMFRKYLNEDSRYLRNTNQCVGKYGACAFLPACLDGGYSPVIYKKK